MMLLNNCRAGTSTSLGVQMPAAADRTSPLSLAGVALQTVVGGPPASQQRKRPKWTRHRGGEWSLRPGIAYGM